MALRPDETGALARIESRLTESEPALAAMFAAFAADRSRLRERCQRLARPRAELLWLTIGIVLAAGLAACITMAVFLA